MDNQWGEPGVEEIENALRQALQHVPAPQGFADRVLRRAEARVRDRDLPRPVARPAFGRSKQSRTLILQMAAAAAVVMSAAGGALHIHHVREQQRALEEQSRAVDAQLDLALHLTTRAIHSVNAEVNESQAGRYTRAFLDDSSNRNSGRKDQ